MFVLFFTTKEHEEPLRFANASINIEITDSVILSEVSVTNEAEESRIVNPSHGIQIITQSNAISELDS